MNAEERNRKAWICRPCHSQIHHLYTEKELEREFNTIDKLKEQADVQKWVAWVRKRPTVGMELR